LSNLALALVLAAALTHATWNLLAKRAGGSAVFMWTFAVISSALYAPVAGAVLWTRDTPIRPIHLVFAAGSAALHGAYFLALGKGYRAGDLSVVYPLARGTGPLLSTLAAVVLYRERPSALAVAGALGIGAGVFLLAGDPRRLRGPGTRAAVRYALLTGAVIALYTLWDKYAVSTLAIHPVVYEWLSGIGRTLLLCPIALLNRRAVAAEWRAHRWMIVGVAILAPLGYIFVLTALSFSPVSYVAPAREVSILIGTLMGTHLLAERDPVRKLAGAGAMLAGTVALALG
jgi:drug/metabolite transporter (DMT)-like permease